jgi:DNA-binding beta-propeller fold protein YncE
VKCAHALGWFVRAINAHTARSVRAPGRWTLAAVAVTAAITADAADAGAQEPTLRYAASPGSCIAALPTPGCEPLRGVKPAPNDRNALRGIAISPDGRNVYLAFEGSRRPIDPGSQQPTRDSAVVVLRRNSVTGALSQLPGRRGCLSLIARRGCMRARAIDDPWGLAVSSDGQFAYATSVGRAAAAVFSRDRRSGALRQLPGRHGCIRPLPRRRERCTYARLGGFPDAAYLSPDGAFLYAFERPLRRNRTNGVLTPAAPRPCPRKMICNLGSLVFAPNSHDVYVLGDRYGISGRRTDVRSGALRRMARAPVCWPFPDHRCANTLGEFTQIAAAPDGRQVYVTLGVSDVVVRFARNRASGLLAPGVAEPVCGGRSPLQRCSMLGGLEDLILSADGRRAYIVLSGTSGISVLAHRRDPRSGHLAPAAWPAGCVTLGQSDDCGAAPPVPGTYWDAVTSPDGRSVYVLASGGVVALKQ